MDLFAFAITVILVTASGALAPGPLFIATVSHGSKSGAKAGFLFSVSHTVVEFSLVMLFALGLLTISSEPFVKMIIGVAGGIVLILFGFLQIRNSLKFKLEEKEYKSKSLLHMFFLGIVFTGLNPYFIIWWLTVGAQLIIISLEFAGLLGVLFMYICHVWMDYAWYTGIAHISKKGANVVGFNWYKYLLMFFGGVLIYFGVSFLFDVFI